MSTQHLLTVANRLEHIERFQQKADEVLLRWQEEPLMDGLYETPQSPRFHAEGPTVRHHLRLILTSLYAILGGEVKLLAIEEFARMKNYQGEIQEMEEMIKEHAASMVVFSLIHDVGKQFCVGLDEQSRVRYTGHEKYIWRADIQDLLKKMAVEYRLSGAEMERVTLLTSEHLFLLRHFSHEADSKKIEVISAIAKNNGVDADDYLDLLQACALIDQVFGSRQLIASKKIVTADHLINSFIAEAEFAPWKREQLQAKIVLEKKQQENRLMREIGLDGRSLMQLLVMKPGRALGVLLKEIQAAALGKREINDGWDKEVIRRIKEAHEKLKREV